MKAGLDLGGLLPGAAQWLESAVPASRGAREAGQGPSKLYSVKEYGPALIRESGFATTAPVLGQAGQVPGLFRDSVLSRAGLDGTQEVFVVFVLDRKQRLLGFHVATLGTASSSLVHPREVFRMAIMLGGSAIVVAHNHPSGDPGPSAADVQVTRQLREAARTVDIDFMDHVIVGEAGQGLDGCGYYSFREAGLP